MEAFDFVISIGTGTSNCTDGTQNIAQDNRSNVGLSFDIKAVLYRVKWITTIH